MAQSETHRARGMAGLGAVEDPAGRSEYGVLDLGMTRSDLQHSDLDAWTSILRQGALPVAKSGMTPLLYAGLLFACGVTSTRVIYLRPSWLLVAIGIMAGLAGLAIFRAARVQWLPVGAVWLLLGCWSAEMEPMPAADPGILQLSDGLLRVMDGTVTDAGPVRSMEEDFSATNKNTVNPKTLQRVDLHVTAAEVVDDAGDTMQKIRRDGGATVRLTVMEAALKDGAQVATIACGQRMRVAVRLMPQEHYRDPGVWDRSAYLEQQAISATATVIADQAGPPRLRLIGVPVRSANCILNTWRSTAAERLQSLPRITAGLPSYLRAVPDDSAMLAALLTGDRSFLNRRIRVGFETTGTFHLIVVSGLHLAILSGLIFSLCRRVRIPLVMTTLLTILVTLGYAVFTGFGVPVQRSLLMIVVYLIGRLLYRDRSPLNVIGFAALCLMAASPRSVFDASLQMTLLAVAAIAGLGVPLSHGVNASVRATTSLRQTSLDIAMPPQLAQFRVTLRMFSQAVAEATHPWIGWRLLPWMVGGLFRLVELALITLVVELALALPMAMYFHRITLYAMSANMVILPMLALLVPSSMLLLTALLTWPAVAVVPAAAVAGLLHFGVWLVKRLGALTMGDWRIPDPSAWQNSLCFMLFAAALLVACSRLRTARRLAFAALAAMALIAVWPRTIDRPGGAMLFEAIDVGQGDALLLMTPQGKTMLVDAGGVGFQRFHGTAETESAFDIGEDVVSPTLWARGIRRLDVVALSHAHNDHMGGLGAVLRNFNPRELWVGSNPGVPDYQALLREAAGLKIPVRKMHAGEQTDLGGVKFAVLAPAPDYHPGATPTNNDSMVLRASYGKTSILLMGDAEAMTEDGLLAGSGKGALQSTVLKVGHHGSLSSTSPGFLKAASPQWAVISCGLRNRFGHPRSEILAELEGAGVRTMITETEGASCLVLDGETVRADSNCGRHQ